MRINPQEKFIKDQLKCCHVSLILSQIGIMVLVDSKYIKPHKGRVRGIPEVAEDSFHSLQEASLPCICNQISRSENKGDL